MPTSPRRSAVVTVGAITVALSLTGCGTSYTGVCADTRTNTRVADKDCEDDASTGSSGGGHGWYFIAGGRSAPAVGAPLAGGTFIAPDGASTTKGGVSAKGGTVAKGGFGGFRSSFGG